jgi:hypothetical protein
MTETPAVYLSEIPEELLRALREIIRCGYGEIVIKIADHKIDVIEKKESVKVRK